MENKIRDLIMDFLPKEIKEQAEQMTIEEIIELFYTIYGDLLKNNGDGDNGK